MTDFNGIIAEQVQKIGDAYQLLKDIMPEYFFRTFADRIGKVLPFLCNLDQQSGIRRADFNGEVFFVYLLSEDNNPAVTSRMMDGQHLLNASLHQSEKTFLVGNEPATLIIEHYTLVQGAPATPHVTLEKLQKEYVRQYGNGQEEALAELFGRLNFNVLADLDCTKLVQRIEWVLRAQKNDFIEVEISEWNQENLRLAVAWPMPTSNKDFCSQLLEIILTHGLEPRRCYFREISSNNDITAFDRQPIMLATMYLNPRPGDTLTPARLDALLKDIRMLGWVEMNDLLHQELVKRQHFSLPAANWIRCLCEFLHSQLTYIDRNDFTHHDITRYLAIYSNFSGQLFAEFEQRFNPALPHPNAPQEAKFHKLFYEQIEQINTGNQNKNYFVKTILRAALNFLECILKSNFYSIDKTALAFRLSADFCKFYRTMSEHYASAFPADIPHGVFFFYRRKTVGYQIRFTDIARGGWRSVIPGQGNTTLDMQDNYEYARDEAFRECYVLAHTQQLKNKDIYEGGSKVLTLLEPISDPGQLKPVLWQMQRSITVAFLSLINYDEQKTLRDKNIVDRLGSREIIEIGPDENMFDTMIEWIGNYASEVGYTLGSGLISGKPGAGINHKEYGVTSFGVHQYLLKTLEELGIQPQKDSFSVKIAGGPGGDVAGNEMKLLLAEEKGVPLYPNLRIIAITDGPAIAYDPDGLDRVEIKRLIHAFALDSFNPEKLHGEGALFALSKPIIENGKQCHRQYRVQGGKLLETLLSQDEFMQLFQDNLIHYADVFIPGGGRPSTINEENWQSFFPNGKASFKAIVEGANSYITPKARDLMQQQGLWIIKDASANKCGVITSSFEILSGLMLDEEEFKTNKEELVAQVMEILRHLSRQEANWLYSKFLTTGTPLTDLTEKLSREINTSKTQIADYLISHPEFISEELLLSHLPPIFRTRFPERWQRIPEEYQRALAGVELACRLVYSEQNLDLGNRLLMIMTEKEKKAIGTVQ
ncbi:MAG: NAD-glutamate dehydrogenase domain-containing protein [Lentisphaeria bacterium]